MSANAATFKSRLIMNMTSNIQVKRISMESILGFYIYIGLTKFLYHHILLHIEHENHGPEVLSSTSLIMTGYLF